MTAISNFMSIPRACGVSATVPLRAEVSFMSALQNRVLLKISVTPWHAHDTRRRIIARQLPLRLFARGPEANMLPHSRGARRPRFASPSRKVREGDGAAGGARVLARHPLRGGLRTPPAPERERPRPVKEG